MTNICDSCVCMLPNGGARRFTGPEWPLMSSGLIVMRRGIAIILYEGGKWKSRRESLNDVNRWVVRHINCLFTYLLTLKFPNSQCCQDSQPTDWPWTNTTITILKISWPPPLTSVKKYDRQPRKTLTLRCWTIGCRIGSLSSHPAIGAQITRYHAK